MTIMNTIIEGQKLKKYLSLLLVSFSIFTFNSCEKDVSVSPAEEIPPKGYIYINSAPEGAKIYLNDKNTGRVTPDSIRWLSESVYKVTLKLPIGYRDTTLYLSVKEDKRTEVFVDYLANPAMRGRIWCTSIPSGSEIYLNGTATGHYTPDTIKSLLPGTYSVKYVKPGYWSDSIQIKLTSSTIMRAHKALVDTTVWVIFNSANSKIPTEDIYDITFDAAGRMWVATHENGILVKEGTHWKVYNQSNSSLPENFIKKIVIDKQQNVWAATNASGLVKFDGSVWTIYSPQNSAFPGMDVSALAVAPDGKIWAAALGTGLSFFDGSRWQTYNKTNSSIPSDYFQCIAFDPDGVIYGGTYDAGLAIFENSKWSLITKESHALPHNNIVSVAVDDNGVVWMGLGIERGVPTGGVGGGLVKYDGNAATKISGTYGYVVNDIYIEGNGIVWSAMDGAGVLKVTGTSARFYNKSNSSIPTNNIKTVCVDRQGNKWFGSTLGGLVKYKGQ